MDRGMQRGLLGVVVLAIATGCAVHFAKRSPWDIQQLAQLSDQLEQFKTLARLKAEEADQLRQAKALLDQQVSPSEVSVGYDERGLVARMVDRVLFDPGKATLRSSTVSALDEVASVLRQFPDQPVGVEGHTDDQPIKYSGWADNKALSLARARAVADYLIERHGIDRSRITMIGYGEEHPVASNEQANGRQQNRRVEIVILPQGSEPSYQAEAGRVSGRQASYTK